MTGDMQSGGTQWPQGQGQPGQAGPGATRTPGTVQPAPSTDEEMMQLLASGGAPRSAAEDVGVVVPSDVVMGSGREVVFAGPESLPSGTGLSALLDGMRYTGAERSGREAFQGLRLEQLALGATFEGGVQGGVDEQLIGLSPFRVFDFVLGREATLPSGLPRELVSSILRAEEAFQAREAGASPFPDPLAVAYLCGAPNASALLQVTGILFLFHVLSLKAQLGAVRQAEREEAQQKLAELREHPLVQMILKANLKNHDLEIARRSRNILYPPPAPQPPRTWNIVDNPKDREEWEEDFAALKLAKKVERNSLDPEEVAGAREAKDKLIPILRDSLVMGLMDVFAEDPARNRDAAGKTADAINHMLDHPEDRGPGNVHAESAVSGFSGVLLATGKPPKYSPSQIFRLLACLPE